MNNKSILIIMLTGLVLTCGTLSHTQGTETIYASGVAYLPENCPLGFTPVLTVKLVWKDLDPVKGGTGRKIEGEAKFAGKQGEKKVKFVGVRVTPSFPRGEMSINVTCELRKGNMIAGKFVMDEKDKNAPKPMSYQEANQGGLLNLELKLKPSKDKEKK